MSTTTNASTKFHPYLKSIWNQGNTMINKSVHHIEYIWIWAVQPSTGYEINKESFREKTMVTKSVQNIEYKWIWAVQPSTGYESNKESFREKL